MTVPQKPKRRINPTKRVRYAAIITRYADALGRAQEVGKLRSKFVEPHKLMALRKRYLEHLRAHRPAVMAHLEGQLLRLANKLAHYVWIMPKTENERKQFSIVSRAIGRFIYDSNSLEAKLFALARLRAIIRSAKPQIHSYDSALQRRFIQQLVRLEHELRTRSF